jgi:hypothetical protein
VSFANFRRPYAAAGIDAHAGILTENRKITGHGEMVPYVRRLMPRLRAQRKQLGRLPPRGMEGKNDRRPALNCEIRHADASCHGGKISAQSANGAPDCARDLAVVERMGKLTIW